MNPEYKDLTSLIRRNAPIFIGMLVMFVCSMLYCTFSATVGRLDNATGVLLFGHMVGNISRYWDPFIMGVFAGIVTYLWGKVPPVRPYRWVEFSTEQCVAFGFLVIPILGYLVWKSLGSYFVLWNCAELFMVGLVGTQFTPFGMRGAVVPLAINVLVNFSEFGIVAAILFFTLIYLGKWISWWVVNVIRHGFKGAKSALKSSGDAGAVVQQS